MGTIHFSVKRPVTVSMLTVAVVLFGLVSFQRLPLNLLPELSYFTLFAPMALVLAVRPTGLFGRA